MSEVSRPATSFDADAEIRTAMAALLPAERSSSHQVGVDPHDVPIEKIDPADEFLMEADEHWGYFARLREEAPVHYCADSPSGPYWSILAQASSRAAA